MTEITTFYNYVAFNFTKSSQDLKCVDADLVSQYGGTDTNPLLILLL
jgi:hypothetical protein